MYDQLAIFMDGGGDHLARKVVQNQIHGTSAVFRLFCISFLFIF